ncbi:hypothetical protein HDV57DRAFT_302877 [Trichoderma longibrachiatum]|uniref:Uncharacterized protein n=1 Tax=Trichoderma longibrachiatum ATCC 18648 TaxID=983965 RepID=A0A2T4CC88_TRILO|nr:hypothetical protein M440DRAFT_231276 [Trichoderma longibrachiatum ATCC 18648]
MQGFRVASPVPRGDTCQGMLVLVIQACRHRKFYAVSFCASKHAIPWRRSILDRNEQHGIRILCGIRGKVGITWLKKPSHIS